jgi:desampylase
MTVRISRALWCQLTTLAAAHPAHEVCGLLFSGGDGLAAQACGNVSAQPERTFEIDPAALLAAQRNQRNGGPQLAGYFHSHPGGMAAPSATDHARAAPDGKLWLIIAGETITAWRAGVDGLQAVPIDNDD